MKRNPPFLIRARNWEAPTTQQLAVALAPITEPEGDGWIELRGFPSETGGDWSVASDSAPEHAIPAGPDVRTVRLILVDPVLPGDLRGLAEDLIAEMALAIL